MERLRQIEEAHLSPGEALQKSAADIGRDLVEVVADYASNRVSHAEWLILRKGSSCSRWFRVRRVFRYPQGGDSSPLSRASHAGHDARRRVGARAHLCRVEGGRRIGPLHATDPDRGGTTRLRGRIHGRNRPGRALPHGTLAVIEDAGHALMHERRDLVAALLVEWLDRAADATTEAHPRTRL